MLYTRGCSNTFKSKQSHNAKGLLTYSLTSMTHVRVQQLPFSPMKGDPLPLQRTSRCITKPHTLIMVSVSFSYTGQHLLIYVTSASSLKVLTGHLGIQISLLFKLFLLESCFIFNFDCAITLRCTVHSVSHVLCAIPPPSPKIKLTHMVGFSVK